MVWEQLKTCYDPEIPVNIVDLGLVYGMEVAPIDGGAKRVDVKMTLTAQGCGMGASIAIDARQKLLCAPRRRGGQRRPGMGSAVDPADDFARRARTPGPRLSAKA